MVHALVAVYFWEVILSLNFEYGFIKGTRKFNWPMSAQPSPLSLMAVPGPQGLTDCMTLNVVPSEIGWVLSTSWASTNLAIRAYAQHSHPATEC
ncbi:hypothetical protein NLI96_g3581 [Meripilus lineatus]|uniref:Uncharacterized protein n=1 Tax=Meripilus lineatus TaxID=2056292 RepID=A0AAD5V6I3_9APHY|nr:hypothetical protein NLI96_g3581 [Physisporinus lineatus]